MALNLRAAAVAAALAGTTILAAPASAAPLGEAPARAFPAVTPDFSRYDPAADSAQWGCRWNCGWGRWGGGWGRRGWRRNRIDGGDVLIGAAIIGGAIAIANSNNRRRERERDVVIVERDRDFRDRDWDRDSDTRYRDDRRAAPRGTGASGLDNAVNMCLDRIERDVRVDTVDNVERTASGWQVSGSLFNGSGFRCRIGNSGQIDAVDYDGSFGGGDWRGPQSSLAPAPGQLSDESYAALRAGVGGDVRPDLAVSEANMTSGALAATPSAPRTASATALPAYPGGPIPGEVIPETLEELNGG